MNALEIKGKVNTAICYAKVVADGTKYLIIHSGSRNLGKQVAELYQRLEDIIDVIRESVDVIDVMKPIYNFKASD